MRKLLPGALALAAGLVLSTAARAETTECTVIATLPYVITVQGVYCLKQHLGTAITSGAAITINTNNVTIDFNGWKLGGLAAGAATDAVGVYAENRRNITLQNGNIRGFRFGIRLDGSTSTSSGHVIEDNLLDGNTSVGIDVSGTGIVIRNNRVVNTDSTPPAGPVSAGGGSSAIVSVAGKDQVIGRRNRTQGYGQQPMAGTGIAVNGINLANVSNSQIVGNFVSNSISSGDQAYGLFIDTASNLEVSNNTVLNTIGQNFTTGIFLLDQTSDITIQDNKVIKGSAATNTAIGIEIIGTHSNIACLNNTVINFTDGQTAGCDAVAGTFPP